MKYPEFFKQIVRNPIMIATVALALRIIVMIAEHTYRMGSVQEGFGLGWEIGRIAYSVSSGHGFSSPFHGNTGPTAWVAPIYPYVVAAVFNIFGAYSDASALILLTLNSFFSALTCLCIYFIALRTLGMKTALGAAWLWALLPYSMYWAIRWVWETSLSALLLSVAFWLALELKDSGSLKMCALFGLVWGTMALSNPSLLSFLPFALFWLGFQYYRRQRAWILPVTLVISLFMLSITPWMVRNYKTFGKFVFIRSNFGEELHLGNYAGADGLWKWQLHPSQNAAEYADYQSMGEIAYVHERGREAMEFICSHPAEFASLSFKRAYYYWFGTPRSSGTPGLSRSRYIFFLLSTLLAFCGLGLIIRQKKPEAFLYLTLIAVYPMVYYITFPHPRYRHPIEPEMMILGVYFAFETIRLWRSKDVKLDKSIDIPTTRST